MVRKVNAKLTLDLNSNTGTASITSLISRADSLEDPLFSENSDEFVPLHKKNRRSQNNSAVLMSLGCCAPSPPPKTHQHLFELKSTKKKKSGLTNSLRVPLLDIEEGNDEDEDV